MWADVVVDLMKCIQSSFHMLEGQLLKPEVQIESNNVFYTIFLIDLVKATDFGHFLRVSHKIMTLTTLLKINLHNIQVVPLIGYELQYK